MTKAEAIEKVRKLRRHAAGGASAEEASTARAIADELVKRHGILEDEIADAPRANASDDGGRWGGGEFAEFFARAFSGGIGDAFRAAPSQDGTTFYVGNVRLTLKRGGDPVGVDEIVDLFTQFFGQALSSAPSGRRAKNATATVIKDHADNPNRVHLAVNNMRSVCGIGPTFVWTKDRHVAIRSGIPCPHCMETGIIDASKPTLRLPAHRLRDARGRWV